MVAGGVGKCRDILIGELSERLGILVAETGITSDHVFVGIHLNAAASAATAERAIRAINHVTELAAGSVSACEQLAFQHQPHADTLRKQHGGEVIAVANRVALDQSLGHHVAVVLDSHRYAQLLFKPVGERNTVMWANQRP